MNKIVSKSVFKAQALELLREVETTGQSVIVTDRGRPVVEVRPAPRNNPDPLEELRGSVLFYDGPFDPVGADDWEALREPDGR